MGRLVMLVESAYIFEYPFSSVLIKPCARLPIKAKALAPLGDTTLSEAVFPLRILL